MRTTAAGSFVFSGADFIAFQTNRKKKNKKSRRVVVEAAAHCRHDDDRRALNCRGKARKDKLKRRHVSAACLHLPPLNTERPHIQDFFFFFFSFKAGN